MRIRPFSISARLLAVVGLAALGATSFTNAGAASAATTPGHYGVKPIHQGIRPLASSNTLKVGSSASQGVVSPTPKVYLVFWGSQWSADPAGVAPDMQKMFKGLYGSQDTWGTILSQYCEGVAKGTSDCGTKGTHIVHPTSTPLVGTWFDNASAAPPAPPRASWPPRRSRPPSTSATPARPPT